MGEDKHWAKNNCVDCGWGFVVSTRVCTCRAGPCSAERARRLCHKGHKAIGNNGGMASMHSNHHQLPSTSMTPLEVLNNMACNVAKHQT